MYKKHIRYACDLYVSGMSRHRITESLYNLITKVYFRNPIILTKRHFFQILIGKHTICIFF